MSMQYQFTDLMRNAMFNPWSAIFDGTLEVVTHDCYPLKHTPFGRMQAASLESVSRLLSSYPKREFDIAEAVVDGRTLPVTERVVDQKPFCHLTHFATENSETRPKVLIVAALAGHHATLARETYSAFLPDHDVYVTDWRDARYVPMSAGSFGFEDYVRYLIEFLQFLGVDTHVVAICQATVPTLTAVAAMAGRNSPNRPRSMTLMAGPIDIRANPGTMTRMAEYSSLSLQRMFTVMQVPPGYPGAGRRVYPGLVQLSAFLCFNLQSHLQKHVQFFFDVFNQEHGAAQKHREFYDEYFSVLDVAEEYYLETLERVFFDQHLPKGTMQFDGSPVNCGDICDVPLLTVEGAEDDMCQVGMTAAAHDLCTGLDESQRQHYVQPGVGHYGVFSGSRYRAEVAPRIKNFIESHSN